MLGLDMAGEYSGFIVHANETNNAVDGGLPTFSPYVYIQEDGGCHALGKLSSFGRFGSSIYSIAVALKRSCGARLLIPHSEASVLCLSIRKYAGTHIRRFL